MSDRMVRIRLILQGIDNASAVVSKYAKTVSMSAAGMQKKLDAFSSKQTSTGAQSIAQGLAIAAPMYAAAKAATAFEDKMIDIRKQMQVDNSVTVEKMKKQIMQLAHEVPMATDQIQEMIASGLRMGIAEDKIISYTKEVSKMSIAFGMGAEEIADQMGKISNVYNIPIEKVGKFADVINYLDDNTMAKGPELIDVIQRIGGAASKLNPKQAAGLSAAMLSFGESPERAGTSISALLNTLSSATMKTAKFQIGMQQLGLSSKDVQKGMSDSKTAMSTVNTVMERIAKIDPKKQTEILVRLFGQDHAPKLAKLAANMGKYKEIMAMSEDKKSDGSMNKEFQKRVQSTSANLQIMNNRLSEVSVKLGEKLTPMLVKALEKLTPLVDKFVAFIEKHPKLISNLAKITLGFSALALIGGYTRLVMGGFTSGLNLMLSPITLSTRFVGWLTDSQKGLGYWTFVARYRMLQFSDFMSTKLMPMLKSSWSTFTGFLGAVWGALVKATVAAWNFTIALLSNPTTWVVIGVMALIAALILCYKHFAKFRALIAGVVGMGKALIDVFIGVGKVIAGAFTLNPKMIIEGGKQAAAAIKDIASGDAYKKAYDASIKKSAEIEKLEKANKIKTPQPQKAKTNMLTGQMKGVNETNMPQLAIASGGALTFNATINLSGTATQQDANMISATLKKQFTNWYEEYQRNKKRTTL